MNKKLFSILFLYTFFACLPISSAPYSGSNTSKALFACAVGLYAGAKYIGARRRVSQKKTETKCSFCLEHKRLKAHEATYTRFTHDTPDHDLSEYLTCVIGILQARAACSCTSNKISLRGLCEQYAERIKSIFPKKDRTRPIVINRGHTLLSIIKNILYLDIQDADGQWDMEVLLFDEALNFNTKTT